MAREDPYFRLRIPERLKDLVEGAAELNKRSMTAEIIARLEASFDDEEDAVEVLQDHVAGMDQRLQKVEFRLNNHTINEGFDAVWEQIDIIQVILQGLAKEAGMSDFIIKKLEQHIQKEDRPAVRKRQIDGS